MLSWVNLDLVECSELQSLWAGYGTICAIKARPRPLPLARTQAEAITQSLILKIVSPPRGRADEGHLRKVLSYEVEQFFYHQVAPKLGALPLARCLVSTSSLPQKASAAGLGHLTASILTDLRPQYPVAGEKRAFLTPAQVHAALRWLATFHGSYWSQGKLDLPGLILPPLQESSKRRRAPDDSGRRGLWLNGGYTYLATRRDEYNSLARDAASEWSGAFCAGNSPSVAELAAAFLTPCGRDYETFLHGDVKSENLFATESGHQVAFFDFQYAGLGLGVCDLAKLFTCSVPVDMLTPLEEMPRRLTMGQGERALLEEYRKGLLLRGNAPEYDWDEFTRHWETALVDWCRFQASWGFWGNTEWLQARVRAILHQGEWLQWIENRPECINLQ
jgi:hypothetical protein